MSNLLNRFIQFAKQVDATCLFIANKIYGITPYINKETEK
jgi:hypothetical protein